jgi:taurine dioxygenase
MVVSARTALPFSVQPFDGPFGVAISGVDLACESGNPNVMDALVDQLHAHRVIVIKGQSLTPDEYFAFGRQWGEPIVHVLSYSRPELSPGGIPAIAMIGNTTEAAKEEKHRLSAMFWHTDQSYEDVPASATMLYFLKTPKTGGQTLLADMVAAYDALSDDMKARIENLTAIHLYGSGAREANEYDATKILTDEDRKRIAPVKHKLVIRHPYNGRKALYAVAGSPIGIEGMADDEAQKLLHDLKQHATSRRFRYDLFYEPGDLAIWDTLATLHSATPIDYATSEEDKRLIWRISCRGAPDSIRRRAGLPEAKGQPPQHAVH